MEETPRASAPASGVEPSSSGSNVAELQRRSKMRVVSFVAVAGVVVAAVATLAVRGGTPPAEESGSSAIPAEVPQAPANVEGAAQQEKPVEPQSAQTEAPVPAGTRAERIPVARTARASKLRPQAEPEGNVEPAAVESPAAATTAASPPTPTSSTAPAAPLDSSNPWKGAQKAPVLDRDIWREK